MAKGKKNTETTSDLSNLLNGSVKSDLTPPNIVEMTTVAEEVKQVRWASVEERKSLTHDGRKIREGKDGKEGMFYLRDFEPTTDWEGACALAGDNYIVEKKPIYYEGGNSAIPDYFATVKSDDGKALGIVSSETEIYQPREIWSDIVAPILEHDPESRIISSISGAFGGSDHIQGIQVSLGSHSPTGDSKDTSTSYFSAIQSWDNVHALKLKGPVDLRAICNNTLAHQAISAAIKHRADMREKIQEALEIVLGIRKINQDQNATLARMATVKLGENEAENLFANLMLSDFDKLIGKKVDRNPFAMPGEFAELKGKALTSFDNNMSEFQRLLHADEGGGVAPGTAYGTYQALSTWANHGRRTRVVEGKTEEQVRLDSQMFGSGEQFHRTAYGILSTLN